jgi:hypothetical protein
MGSKEAKWLDQRNNLEIIAGHPPVCDFEQESDMAAFAARRFPKASAKSMAEFETFVSVALFYGVGLLMSLSVFLLNKYIPGEWF